MKKLITILILTYSVTVFSQELSNDLGYAFLPETVMSYDGQKHFMGGAFLGGTSYLYFRGGMQQDRPKAIINSLGFVTTIGLVKESNDYFLGGRQFSLDDIASNTFGWAVGMLLADWIYEINNPSPERLAKRNERKEKRHRRKNPLIN